MIKFSFHPDRILRATALEEEFRGIATELLELVMESTGGVGSICVKFMIISGIVLTSMNQPVDIALVFVTRDLGGSVLKQVLHHDH